MRKGHLHILAHREFEICDRILVACSGGPDSLATLSRFSKKYGTKVEGLFIHHNTLESNQGEKILRQYAYSFGIHYWNISKDIVPTEANWSYARRAIYNEEINSPNYKKTIIVTGHHLDDAVEEYLINISKRGSATTLKYNYPNPSIFRPMLLNNKKNFKEYCDARNIRYFDSSNSINLRNKIRKSSIVNDINSLMGTNLETIVKKKILKEYEYSKIKKMGPIN